MSGKNGLMCALPLKRIVLMMKNKTSDKKRLDVFWALSESRICKSFFCFRTPISAMLICTLCSKCGTSKEIYLVVFLGIKREPPLAVF